MPGVWRGCGHVVAESGHPTRVDEPRHPARSWKRLAQALAWQGGGQGHRLHRGEAITPAAVRAPEPAKRVIHTTERGQTGGWDEGPGSSEHIRRLLPLLPLGSAVLEPHLESIRMRGTYCKVLLWDCQ